MRKVWCGEGGEEEDQRAWNLSGISFARFMCSVWGNSPGEFFLGGEGREGREMIDSTVTVLIEFGRTRETLLEPTDH